MTTIKTISDHADKIVLYGMSCVGKTTFAQALPTHQYHCFDALFQWHLLETLGLSAVANLEYVRSVCTNERYILDGWHLSDQEGILLPPEAVVYVIYADYDHIIKQYRIPVEHVDDHWPMFKKWYGIPYGKFKKVRYFFNAGEFSETSSRQFQVFLTRSLQRKCSSLPPEISPVQHSE